MRTEEKQSFGKMGGYTEQGFILGCPGPIRVCWLSTSSKTRNTVSVTAPVSQKQLGCGGWPSEGSAGYVHPRTPYAPRQMRV